MQMNLVHLCMGLYLSRGSIVNNLVSNTGRAVAEWRGGRRGSGNRALSTASTAVEGSQAYRKGLTR